MNEWENFKATIPKRGWPIKFWLIVAFYAWAIVAENFHIEWMWKAWLGITIAFAAVIGLGVVIGVGQATLVSLWKLRGWIIVGLITLVVLHFILKYW